MVHPFRAGHSGMRPQRSTWNSSRDFRLGLLATSEYTPKRHYRSRFSRSLRPQQVCGDPGRASPGSCQHETTRKCLISNDFSDTPPSLPHSPRCFSFAAAPWPGGTGSASILRTMQVREGVIALGAAKLEADFAGQVQKTGTSSFFSGAGLCSGRTPAPRDRRRSVSVSAIRPASPVLSPVGSVSLSELLPLPFSPSAAAWGTSTPIDRIPHTSPPVFLCSSFRPCSGPPPLPSV
jgi:hypothetical protein